MSVWAIVTKPPLNAIQRSGRGAQTVDQADKVLRPAAQERLLCPTPVNLKAFRKYDSCASLSLIRREFLDSLEPPGIFN